MLEIPGKIPIRIYPLFFIVVMVISLMNSHFQIFGAVLWAIVIFFSLLVHEFGHALTAMAFGQRAAIDLVGFGGLTRRHGRHLKPFEEFLIVLNGPLAGFLLSGLAYLILLNIGPSLPILFQELLWITIYINLVWTVLNLVPVQPLDGGHLLRIILEGCFGLRGLKIALFVGFLTGLVFSIYFFVVQYFVVGAFFLLFTFESYRSWKSSLSMSEQDENHSLQQFLKSAERDVHKGHLSYAQEKLSVILKQVQEGVLYNSATILLARIYHTQGHNDKAYQLLVPLKKRLSSDNEELFQKVAYQQKHWQEVIDIGKKVYQEHPTYNVALLNAYSHAQLGQVIPALGWLQCAIKNGLPNIKEIIGKPEFDALRSDPQFHAFTNNTICRK